jgi:hypothetical protein
MIPLPILSESSAHISVNGSSLTVDVEGPDLVAGRGMYGIDTPLDEMLCAVVARTSRLDEKETERARRAERRAR